MTASAFQEQDRVNVDYDELIGNFSQGSVMTNRKMGETVGGMKMLALADTNGDKAVTQAEFRKAAEARFAKADTDNDGTISAAERKSMRKDRWDRRPPPPESGAE